ncbi:MAG: ABC transporter substrate-binding protein [Syntrophomonas sp.]
MARVLVHLPLNISRALDEMLKAYGRVMEKKHGIKVEIVSQLQCQPDSGGLKVKPVKEDIPDLVLGHVNYFAGLSDEYVKEHFRTLPGRFDLRPELSKAGFTDQLGYFHPFVVVPFAIFYNPDVLEEKELPRVWEDLLDKRWRGRIAMPDEYHMAPRMIRSLVSADYPEGCSDFRENLVYLGAPINVVNAVDEGRCPLGITNISFARISHHKNIQLMWPGDGMYCMPLVMVWNKDADERLLEIGDFLLSRQVQEYLALQTFVPVSPEVAIPALLNEHGLNLRWRSWEDYLQAVRADEYGAGTGA